MLKKGVRANIVQTPQLHALLPYALGSVSDACVVNKLAQGAPRCYGGYWS